MRKVNKKGFTLIELLAVIIILGLLMAIAIPSVTRYIDQSRKKTLVSTIDSYIGAAVTGMNNGDYAFTSGADTVTSFETNTLYAIPVQCISLEKGGSNPYGNWETGSYVLVVYNANNGYRFGFQFRDSTNHYMEPTIQREISLQKIGQGTDAASKAPAIDASDSGTFAGESYTRAAVMDLGTCQN